MKTGRPAGIPPGAFAEVKRLHGLGYGCRRIAAMLEGRAVYTTKSSVERLLKGQAPYAPG